MATHLNSVNYYGRQKSKLTLQWWPGISGGQGQIFLKCCFKLQFHPETRNIEYLLRFKQLRFFADLSKWKKITLNHPS